MIPFDRHDDQERRLRQFEDAWKAGTPPALAAYLPAHCDQWPHDPAVRDLIVELIAVELEYRLRREEVQIETYCELHDLGPIDGLPVDLLAAEYEARCLAGKPPDVETFLARFPSQAEALRPLLVRRRGETARVAAPGDDTRAGDTLADASSEALATLLQSLDILEPEHREPLTQRVASRAHTTAADLLAFAVERSWLTSFQAEQILAGRGEQLLRGPYVLLRPLGEGGMSKVFLARHRRLQRNVAFKVIRRTFIADAGEVAVRRFYQEMEAVGRLSHANLIHAYDAGPVAGTHFLAMEYVDGVDLGRLVRERGPLPVAEACSYVYQTALGLQHVFECGLVHRDLKPSNLLLAIDPTGETAPVVKILDLGLASLRWSEGSRSRAGLTGADAFLGTPDYIAPEQALDPKTADIRADLYSLGCTFYHLLTGVPPFPGGTVTQKLQRHLEEPAPPIASLRSDVPPGIAAMVDRLLAKQPGDRFATPRELADALTAGAAPAPLPFAAPAAASPRRRRLWIAASLFLVFLVAGLLAVGGLAWAPRGQPEPPDPLDAAWETLRAKTPRSDADHERLRRELREFHVKHPGTKQGEEAGIAARTLPSVLDRLVPLNPRETTGVVATFDAHDTPVYGVSIAPDGMMLATSGSGDLVIKLWDLRGGKFQIREKLQGHLGGVHSVRFAPDGRTLLSTGFDHTAHLWDLGTTPALSRHTFRAVPGCVETAIFSLDGRGALVGNLDGTVRRFPLLRNAVGRGEELPGKVPGIEILAFNRDETLLAVGGSTVRVWALGPEGKQDRGTYKGSAGAIFSLGFSPDSRLLAAGGTDGSIHVWDLTRPGVPPRVLREHQGPLITTVFREDGCFYSAAADGRLIRWQVPAFTKQGEWRAPVPIHRGDFAPDGRHFFTANSNGTVSVLRVTPRTP